jgi:hypothetical protein
MENKNFIPDRIESTQNPSSEKFDCMEGADKDKRTPDNSQTSQNTDDLHLMLQDTQLERPTTMSQEQMDVVWKSLEPELAISVWGPAQFFKLTVGFVTQKLSSDNQRGGVLKMSQKRQTLEEVDLIFGDLSSIIIYKDMRQFQPKSVPEQERVITGSHREENDSWSSSSPSLLFETQQPPMGLQPTPIMPNGLIDPHTIQNLFLQNKLPYKTVDQFCTRIGVNLVNRPEPKP